jgi:hypothetical protein
LTAGTAKTVQYMKRQNVESREYKIMLRSTRFKGDAGALADRANDFFGELAHLAAPLTPGTEGRFEDDGKRRRVTFWDTGKQHLNEAGYICRHRENLENGSREVTLKFRHYDRHVSQDRNMTARGERAKTKFEEDIKKPFVSLYSFSTTVPVEDERPFRRLEDVARLFPGIEAGIRRHDRNERVAMVNDFTARELVLEGAKIKLAKMPKVHAGCALIVWYRGDRDSSQPVAVEFSFRYGDKDERYGGEPAARAFAVFAALQRDLDHWLSKTTLTKTALVYGKGEGV